MRWIGYTACTEKSEIYTKFWMENLKGTDVGKLYTYRWKDNINTEKCEDGEWNLQTRGRFKWWTS